MIYNIQTVLPSGISLKQFAVYDSNLVNSCSSHVCVVFLCFAFAFANYVITFHKYFENDNTHTLSETVLVFD